jgi:hypothetical protein
VGIEIGVEFVGALASGVVAVSLIGLVWAKLELIAPSLTVCVWPRANETENSSNPVKTKAETRLPQKHLDVIFFISIFDVDPPQTDLFLIMLSIFMRAGV